MKQETNNRKKIYGGLIGLIIGDALGVPVEFQPRDSFHITGMTGYGTHNQSPGTWSDDSSLALCTMFSLTNGYNPENIMTCFEKWLYDSFMTAHNEVFDAGMATTDAIIAFGHDRDHANCARTDVLSNGNGSLMRILPASIYFYQNSPEEIIAKSFEVSKFTHGHIRSQLCCAYYSLLVKAIIEGLPLGNALDYASKHLGKYIPADEKVILQRILTKSILKEKSKKISASGYVVHTLEASIWCCSQNSNFSGAVLNAVNLGEDTDTTGAVTGGLAGLIYGLNNIPHQWITNLARVEYVQSIIESFINSVLTDN